MKHRKIIFVCTGNTCRSPMAEAALRQYLQKRRIGWYRVLSAGVAAEFGAPMSEHAKTALREAGIPFSEEFRSQKLSLGDLKEAHAVVCMTERIREMLADFPNVTSFPELCNVEIPDPYGREIEAYRVTLRHIRECLPRVAEVCCPKVEEE